MAKDKATHLLAFYVPKEDAEKVLDALFDEGAGKIGDYDRCCWRTEGTGQFRPLEGSNPSLGQHGQVESIHEWKIELVCREEQIPALLAALKASHPYEEPAYHFISIRT
jgi:hypothetical protein